MEENETKVRKKSFIPSYEKNNELKEEKLKADKKSSIKRRKKIILLIGILLLVAIVAICTTLVLSENKYKKYYEYEDDMIKYGFDKIYDNGSAATKEKVTKSEAVKMVVAAVYNKSDITGIAGTTSYTYSNAIWVEFAKKMDIITDTDVNEDNADEYATYADILRYFSNAKVKILEENLDTDDNGEVKDIEKYNVDEKFAILDMVNNEVVTLNSSKINARKKVFKGEVNELVVNFVEKYNTITLEGEKLNINKDKIPSNADKYPYTLSSVSKEAYEYAFYGEDNEGFKSPVSLFANLKEYYYQIKNNTEEYYNYLLNIDYNTITTASFIADTRKYLLFDLDESIVDEYVNYVKKNKIILSGTAKVQLPAIYFDGEYYRVRTKIEFEVKSSDTNKNLLYRDLIGDTKIYDDDTYSFYIDTYMSNAYENKTLYNKESTFYDMSLESKIKLEGDGND